MPLHEVSAALDSGSELSYVENTSSVAVASTTEGTPTTIVTADNLVVNGSTILLVEFYARGTSTPSPDNSSVVISLWGSTNGGSSFTDLGRLINFQKSDDTGGVLIFPTYGARRLTPGAGTIQYRITAFCSSTTDTPTVFSGAGGAATGMPIFIRVTKV